MALTTIAAAGLAWLAFNSEQVAMSLRCEGPSALLPPGPAGAAAGALLASALLRIAFSARRQADELRAYRWIASLLFWGLAGVTFRLWLAADDAAWRLCVVFE
ncbi:MAG TPA: hypothetical protein VGE07_08420 [Herpetosiphonaceae bacterium]